MCILRFKCSIFLHIVPIILLCCTKAEFCRGVGAIIRSYEGAAEGNRAVVRKTKLASNLCRPMDFYDARGPAGVVIF